MTQPIPRSLITSEALDALAGTLSCTSTYFNRSFQDLTGDAAILGDALLAKVNPAHGIPYLPSAPPVALSDTDMESWFFWACGGSKYTGSFACEAGPNWTGYVTFRVFDTITNNTRKYLAGSDRSGGSVYDNRCKMLDLLEQYSLLPEPTPLPRA